ncbi:MAG: hypothetical protein HC834_02365 [Rhodospirillales bacterium]|nr:hypothetical protein [Rhodospirillales bacterium]
MGGLVEHELALLFEGVALEVEFQRRRHAGAVVDAIDTTDVIGVFGRGE